MHVVRRFSVYGGQMACISCGRKKKTTAAALTETKRGNGATQMYLRHVCTVALICCCSQVNHSSLESEGQNECVCRRSTSGAKLRETWCLLAPALTQVIHLFGPSESRDGPLSWMVGDLTAGEAPKKEEQAGQGALSVNIPQVWERHRKGAGEEEGSGWIAALYGQSAAFPRVCGSDSRHDARYCTKWLPGATKRIRWCNAPVQLGKCIVRTVIFIQMGGPVVIKTQSKQSWIMFKCLRQTLANHSSCFAVL